MELKKDDYKLIATDCDGTLLDSEGYLSRYNKRVLAALHNKGIKILFVTGRNDILVKDYTDELGIRPLIIGCNGATVADFYNGGGRKRIIALQKEELKALFDIFDEFSIESKAFTREACYTNSKLLLTSGMSLVVTKYKKKIKNNIPYHYIENMHKAEELTDVVKVVVIDNNIERLLKLRDKLNESISGIYAVKSNVNCLDIIKKGVSKADAVLAVAREHNISPEQIIAFGDNDNDISMLKAAGLGCAVANASENVRNNADVVIKSNDEDGVGKFLAELFEINDV